MVELRLREKMRSNKVHRDDFNKEVEIAKALPVNGFIKSNGVILGDANKHMHRMFVEDYSGGDLYGDNFKTLLNKLGANTINEKQNVLNYVILKLATSLKELHEAGYVHRDIKPDNIVYRINPEKQGLERLELAFIDYGFVTKVDKEDGFCGTNGYMSDPLKDLEDFGHSRTGNQAKFDDVYAFKETIKVLSESIFGNGGFTQIWGDKMIDSFQDKDHGGLKELAPSLYLT